jgi:hypothetical protein
MGTRFAVLSKDTVNGKHFMDGMVEYELYTIEEIEPYFVETIEKYVLPLITEGKKYVLENQDFYFKEVFEYKIDAVLNKLNASYGSDSHDNSSKC